MSNGNLLHHIPGKYQPYSKMLSSEQNIQECDATTADSSDAVWNKNIILNLNW